MYGVRSTPAPFIPPCRPTVVTTPSSGPGWVHELKHDGYRLQIPVRDGRVRLYTRNGADWTKRYPRIVEEAARLREPIIIDAEWTFAIRAGIFSTSSTPKATAIKCSKQSASSALKAS